jgi:ABC-type oligopeptide transport system substrate-binding subunit
MELFAPLRLCVRFAFLAAGGLVLASPVDAQTPRWDELRKLSAAWPADWAAVVRDITDGRDDFEKEALARVGSLLGAEPKPENYRLADTVLAATLRHHLSVRRPALGGANPAQPVQTELEDRLAKVRKDWLDHLQKSDDNAAVVRLAEQWLPGAGDGPLRSAILGLWLEQAKAALMKPDDAAARAWLDRIDTHFPGAAVDEIRKPLHEKAIKKTPGATLTVAVRSLPEQLSPATASTEVERQALELLFDRLYRVEVQPGLGRRYVPELAVDLPGRSLSAAVALRRDAYWASGERVTAADVRHTALLMNQTDLAGRTALWRDYLEVPRLEGNPLQVNLGWKQGLFDPLAPLTFWVLPRFYAGKELPRADDPEFAKAPVGSGPFKYAGRKLGAAVFQANPHDERRGPIGEIRMTVWPETKKEWEKFTPQLILDAPTADLAFLKERGYALKETAGPTNVHILAVNHRVPALASPSVRRAIAHALDRQGLLNRHFRAEPGRYHATANGLFPRESWANAPAPRVPDELYQKEQATSLARKLGKDLAGSKWTLKFANDDARVRAACTEMAKSLTALFQDAGAEVKAVPLPPAELRKAVTERDYDLLYTRVGRLDDPVRLALFFDRQEDATRTGSSNFLGCEDDKLHELLRTAVQHRQFSVLQESMQAIHVHLYETMPAIPLWQLDTHVLVHPSLRTPPLDAQAVFANVREWKLDKQ